MLLESLLLFATLASAALAPIKVKGNAFFDSESNDRFYMRGVVYEPEFDSLANITSCARDIPALKNLGINTIRVPYVDNSVNHDACMKLLDDAGIYVIVDLDTYIIAPPAYMPRIDPATNYNATYLQQVFSNIDAMKSYNNVLGFFVGRSLFDLYYINGTESIYVKAVIRDTKNYIKKHSTRAIPVGYASPDSVETSFQQIEYLNCGDDEMARADMIGIDNYSWCSGDKHPANYYNDYANQYKDISIPLFFSLFACNTLWSPRFTEISEVYYSNMTSVFSGALFLDYADAENNEEDPWRLVNITQNASGDDTVDYLPAYSYLKTQYSYVSHLSGDGGYKSSGTAASCPISEHGIWEADTSLPPLPSNASVYMINGAGKALSTASSAASIKTSGAGSGKADLLINSKTNGIVLGSLGAVVAIIFGFVGF